MLQDGGIDPRAQPRETLRQYGRFHREPRDADELLGPGRAARRRTNPRTGGCPAANGSDSGLALALVGRPEVVILDEPTAGMDPEARATTRAIVADLRSAGAAILLTSHDLTDVERLADRICILDRRADRRVRDAGRARAGGDGTAALPARPDARARPRWRTLERALAGVRSRDHGSGRRGRWPLPSRGRRARRGRGRGPRRVVRHRRAADRRAADRRRDSRGRVPGARRTCRRLAAAAGRDEVGGMSLPRPLAAATAAQTGMELRLTARRGENVLVTIVIPVVVLLFFAIGRGPADGERARRSTSSSPAPWRWRSSRPASSTSASRPPTSATTGSSSGSVARH